MAEGTQLTPSLPNSLVGPGNPKITLSCLLEPPLKSLLAKIESVIKDLSGAINVLKKAATGNHL
ncbi:hypothetical protein, partial [Levilactobacillus spicheri]|uniref:hypothetical protein n=1 Tax=Levilactobacillus spicheri TaxID=216463 RepID=UPI001CDD74AB